MRQFWQFAGQCKSIGDQRKLYIFGSKKWRFAQHGDIRRVHRTSTKTMQDAIQRACACRNAPMYKLFDVQIASCADLYNLCMYGSQYSSVMRYSAGSRQRLHLAYTGP